MLQANELRVGNIVFYQISKKHKKRIAIIKSISTWPETTCTVDFGGRVPHTVPLEELSGIEFTAEILEEAGFEKDMHPPSDIWVDKNNSMIIFYKDPACNELVKGFYTGYWKYQVEIKFLHHLQNFYYALTRQELNISM